MQSRPLLPWPPFRVPSKLSVLTYWTAFVAFSGIFLVCFCLLCGGLCPICNIVALGIFCFPSQMYDAHERIRISCISNKVACVPQISHIDLRPCSATEALGIESGLLCKHHYMLVPVKSCYLPVMVELFIYRKHQSVHSSERFKQ